MWLFFWVYSVLTNKNKCLLKNIRRKLARTCETSAVKTDVKMVAFMILPYFMQSFFSFMQFMLFKFIGQDGSLNYTRITKDYCLIQAKIDMKQRNYTTWLSKVNLKCY